MEDKKKINFKIIIPIIVIAIVIIIVAIVVIKGTSNNSIELTMENYSNYLNIDISSNGGGTSIKSEKWGSSMATINNSSIISWIFYPQICMKVNVEGVSSNFNYENVVVKVEFDGDYDVFRLNKDMEKEHITETVTVDNCNITGTGNNSITYTIPNNGYSQNSIKGKIVSVSGTVTPVK